MGLQRVLGMPCFAWKPKGEWKRTFANECDTILHMSGLENPQGETNKSDTQAKTFTLAIGFRAGLNSVDAHLIHALRNGPLIHRAWNDRTSVSENICTVGQRAP